MRTVTDCTLMQILGGLASAWGDNVDTALGATGMLYPRALAIGEKLWSPQSATAVTGDFSAGSAPSNR